MTDSLENTKSSKILPFKNSHFPTSYILNKYLNPYQIKKIEKSFNLACEAHKGQVRKSGEAYIHHPLSAASILADFQLDHESIMAAILHDVIEDTEIEKENLGNNQFRYKAQLKLDISQLEKKFIRISYKLDNGIINNPSYSISISK